MDRPIVYTQEIGRSVDFLGASKAAMFGVGFLAQTLLGSSVAIAGLGLAPTGVASLNLLIASGSIYAIGAADASPYGTLAADSTPVMKQGILSPPTTQIGPFAAPATAGFSQNYIIQAAYQDVDGGSIVPPFYNSLNPSVPLTGQGGLGGSNFTIRQGALIVSTKAGPAAATGSQTTPAADAGYVTLYVVTVANGQTAINSSNWITAPTAPFIPVTLPGVPNGVQNGQWVYASSSGTNAYTALLFSTAAFSFAPTLGMEILVYFGNANTSTTVTLNANGTGNKSVVKQGGAAPAIGDVSGYLPLIYDGANWRINGIVSSDVATSPVNTGSGTTYVTTTGTSSVPVPSWATGADVELWGGAGGGGGSSSGSFGSGGGGGGGYAKKHCTGLTSGGTVSCVVGVGGSGGASGGGAGTSGGTTSFGAFVSATGGGGGAFGTSAAGGAGGTGVSGDLNLAGTAGGPSIGTNTAGGAGGASALGGAGTGGGAGLPGGIPGGGGGGCGSAITSAGSAGAQGLIKITWRVS